MQKEEYLIKNACYSPVKYYLCKQNNKRSLLGRKQRSQVARSFPNRYLFSFTNKVTSLFSIRYILIIILHRKRACFATQKGVFYKPICNYLILQRLQRRFLMIIVWFGNNTPLIFVRVFQKKNCAYCIRCRRSNLWREPSIRSEERSSLVLIHAPHHPFLGLSLYLRWVLPLVFCEESRPISIEKLLQSINLVT